MTRQQISTIVFFALLLFFVYEALLLLSPFFGPILCALATAIVCYPIHKKLGHWIGPKRPTIQALISDVAVFLFLLVPAALLCLSIISEIQTSLPTLRMHAIAAVHSAEGIASGTHRGFIPASWMDRLTPYMSELRGKLATMGQQGLGIAAGWATAAAKNLFGFVVDSVIFLIVLFFLFKDGEVLYQQWNDLLPFNESLRRRIHERIQTTTEGVFRSSVIIGFIQGVLFLLGYLIVGFPAAVTFGCLTAVASLLPGIGSGIIWIPLVIYYFIAGSLWKAVVLIVFGGGTALIDGFIRPWIVGKNADMPLLWLMFSVLGGLEVFGAKGLILGPLIFALLPVLLEIYRSYLHEKKSL